MGGGSDSQPTATAHTGYLQDNRYKSVLGAEGEDLRNQSESIRLPIINNYLLPFLQGTLSTRQLPGFSDTYNLARTGFENQYNIAKQALEAKTPRGGAMTDALATLENSRASNVGGLEGQISAALANKMWDNAYNFGTVTGPAAMTAALGGAGQLQQLSLIHI